MVLDIFSKRFVLILFSFFVLFSLILFSFNVIAEDQPAGEAIDSVPSGGDASSNDAQTLPEGEEIVVSSGGGLLDVVKDGAKAFVSGIVDVFTGGGSSNGGSSTPAPNPSQISKSAIESAMSSYRTTWNDAEYFNEDHADHQRRISEKEIDALDVDLTDWVSSHQNAFTEEQINDFDGGSADWWLLPGNGRLKGSGIYSTLEDNLETAKDDTGLFGGAPLFGGSSGKSNDKSGVETNGVINNIKLWSWPGKGYYGLTLGLVLGILNFFYSLFKKRGLISSFRSIGTTVVITEIIWIIWMYNILAIRVLAWIPALIWLAISVWNWFKESDVTVNTFLLVPISLYYSSSRVRGGLDFSTAIVQVLLIAAVSLIVWVVDALFERLNLARSQAKDATKKAEELAKKDVANTVARRKYDEIITEGILSGKRDIWGRKI